MTDSTHARLVARYGARNLRLYDAFTAALWVAVVWVGTLQSRGVHAGFVTNQGGDVAGTLVIQLMLARTLFARTSRGFLWATGVAWFGSVAWECCQLLDLAGTPLGITRGVFDPLDLVAYTVAVAIGLGVDRAARLGSPPTGTHR
jgi:hypothetical protein